jgi:hypothetical protein
MLNKIGNLIFAGLQASGLTVAQPESGYNPSTPMSLSLPTTRVSASLLLVTRYYCAITRPAGRIDLFWFLVAVVVVLDSRGRSVRHLDLK